jgi:hypothetical protein
VWDTYSERHDDDHPLSNIFRHSNKGFSIDERFGEDATVASLRNITDYGTAILQTLSRPGRNSRIYETGEPVRFQTLGDDKYMLDLLTGCLEIVYSNVPGIGYGYFYGFTPSFISTLDAKFKNNLVYADIRYGAELGPVFMQKQAHTFFSYTENALWPLVGPDEQLFNIMVNDGKDAGQAYAEVSPRSHDNSYFVKYSSNQNELSYECITTRRASCSAGASGDSHWTYRAPDGSESTYDTSTQYYAGGPAPDFQGQFTDNIFAMTWDYERYGTHFWGSIEATLDAPPGEASRLVTFTATRNYAQSGGDMATLSETFQGSNVPLTERTDYGIYFEIVGADVCNHVVASGLRDAHRSDGLHQYWYSGIVCNSNGRLYVGFDFLD